ncbi:hypothetical protein K432DRAFT_35959 [Lepidopterella palustris CBS 459.81]|uniref:Uncharacterized protein n=1 Tax=Lepidopterella palustris CBS 459.81 TaxID=1314670 RepID=A0A8E2EC10_9PEZI|nr:hypothetical protein K432DRAFT_35959 [Lepidopterella palustris CBS 459.81]
MLSTIITTVSVVLPTMTFTPNASISLTSAPPDRNYTGIYVASIICAFFTVICFGMIFYKMAIKSWRNRQAHAAAAAISAAIAALPVPPVPSIETFPSSHAADSVELADLNLPSSRRARTPSPVSFHLPSHAHSSCASSPPASSHLRSPSPVLARGPRSNPILAPMRYGAEPSEPSEANFGFGYMPRHRVSQLSHPEGSYAETVLSSEPYDC